MRPLGALRRSRPRLESAAGESMSVRVRVRDRDRRPVAAAGACVLVVLLLVSAASPPAAEANGVLGTGISIPNPISVLGSGINSLLGGLGGDIATRANPQ